MPHEGALTPIIFPNFYSQNFCAEWRSTVSNKLENTVLSPFKLAFSLLLASSLWAQSAPILPRAFAGWQQDAASVKSSSNPADADAGSAAVLKEYGFTDLQSAVYSKEGNRKLTVRAARFTDATGAYGAYTLFSQPGMQTEEIGRHGESAGDRVLFMQGNIVVEARFDHVTPMSGAELRELAGVLPEPGSNLGQLPALPRWLPQPQFVEHSIKFAVGPKSYDQIGAPLPLSAIDFSKSPEILTALYRTDSGNARLTLIFYPTPQIAGTQLRAIEQNRASLQQSGAGDFQIKRTGPLLAIVSGEAAKSDQQSLLGSVNYEAEVTYNEPTFLSKRDNIGNLVVAAFGLIGFILAVAIILGVAFGGIRVLLKRFYPDRFVDRPEDTRVITLNLNE